MSDLNDLLALRSFARTAQAVHVFAWEDWTRTPEGKWRSPGGRVLSDAAYQKLKGRGKGARGAKPAAPAKEPAAAAEPAKPAPKAVRAEQTPVLRRARTLVGGRPVVATAKVKGDGAPTAPPAVTVPAPKPDGTPDLAGLKAAVEAGVESSRASKWNYDFGKARAALAQASKQIDDFARKFPRKVATLAREVTGVEPESTQDGVAILKAWVGETVAILNREPSRLDRGKGKTARMSEGRAEVRAAWFAEVAPRLPGVRALAAALAA